MTRTDHRFEAASGDDRPTAGSAFADLVALMDRLRSPGGCRWDGEQTHESLVRYLIEEAYEVVEAIETPGGVDRALLLEELGDVLLQVVFHARVAEEAEDGFSIVDVIEALNAKMVRRHPHVFEERATTDGAQTGTSDDDGLEALTRRWDEIKKVEKPDRKDPFDGIPPALPALALGEKTLSKAAKAGLVLPTDAAPASPAEPVREPRTQEPGERPARQVSPESVVPGFADEAEQRMGRDLLRMVAEARGLGVDPERALRRAVREYVAQNRGNA